MPGRSGQTADDLVTVDTALITTRLERSSGLLVGRTKKQKSEAGLCRVQTLKIIRGGRYHLSGPPITSKQHEEPAAV